MNQCAKAFKYFFSTSLVFTVVFAFSNQATAGLEIRDVAFKAGVAAVERPERRFSAGELIWITFTIIGFGHDETVWLEQDLDIVGPEGNKVYSAPNASKFKVEWDEELDQAMIRNNLRLSPGSKSGEYKAIITVRDKITGETKRFEEPFHLGRSKHGGKVTSPARARMGNLEVKAPVLTDRKGSPRSNAVFKPGSLLRIRFQVRGASIGKGGLVWLQQDLELTDESGARVMYKKNISTLKKHVSMELDWITMNNDVLLPNNIEPGKYKLVLTLRDRVAGSKAMAWRDILVQR